MAVCGEKPMSVDRWLGGWSLRHRMPAGLPLLGHGPEQLGHERPIVRTRQSLAPELGQDLRHPARRAIDLAGNGMHTLWLLRFD